MIEPIMYVAIGFLVACMLVIGIIPVVHARAVRLTTRRLEAVTPMSMAEIQADKDQLRAEFAMSTRRLEMSVEQMKAKTTSQLAEIGKKSEAIGRIKLELGEKTAALFALEAKEQQLSGDLNETRRQLEQKTTALAETERLLEQARAQLTSASTTVNDTALTVDSQRVELVTARAQIEVLKGQIESYDKESRELHERLTIETTAADATRQALTAEIAKTEQLTSRVTELERQVIAQTTEAEVLGRRVQELLARLDEQGRSVTESDTLRTEASSAQQAVMALRVQLADAENRSRGSAETLTAERDALAEQLKQSQAERDRLQAEIVAMKREVESTWQTERMENAVLRERINDVAAEVARLTSVLEGPGSPIETMLAGAPTTVPLAPAAAAATASTDKRNGESPRGSLADRMRALQTRASQLPQPSRA
jgi:DNA repair exonuclease SbcCD ATPase subunit